MRGKKPLGDVFRDKQKQDGSAADRAAKKAADQRLKELNAELFVAAETLGNSLAELIDSDQDERVIRIQFVPPYASFNLETESSGFQDLLKACKDEDVSIFAKRGDVRTGMTTRGDGRIGTRPKHERGVTLTINPAQPFGDGLTWERRHGYRHGPRFR